MKKLPPRCGCVDDVTMTGDGVHGAPSLLGACEWLRALYQLNGVLNRLHT